ncbi:ABC transporter substrate-binding protein [Marinovum sp.]|uniref:ABC transporter substrate-binding protein n=1 Tax=Marinovum sp. TaxID=2024839 RepID=UPI003A94064C
MRRCKALLLAAALIGAAAEAQEAPRRVVSINLCTDQLAMLLAAPDQLHSVSFVALDRRASSMADEAQDYVINHGRAEEIYLMQPDLVLAGRYTARASVEALQNLGIPVVTFDIVSSMAGVRQSLLDMGAALGRDAAAQAMVADFDSRLAALQAEVIRRPRAALYYANGFTSGRASLAHEILTAAGFDNIALEAGYEQGGKLPLEILALAAPEAVITGQSYPGTSRAEAIMDHPVVRALRAEAQGAALTDADWVCGTPHVLRAIESLVPLRQSLERQ